MLHINLGIIYLRLFLANSCLTRYTKSYYSGALDVQDYNQCFENMMAALSVCV